MEEDQESGKHTTPDLIDICIDSINQSVYNINHKVVNEVML